MQPPELKPITVTAVKFHSLVKAFDQPVRHVQVDAY